MSAGNNAKSGIILMISAMLVFASQDGVSRHLAETYNVPMVVMIRYWFFALFVLALAQRKHGSIFVVARTSQPFLQAFRGLLLAAEICVMVLAFVYLGLIESLAIFAAYPLIVAALSGPILGEHVGWRRWLAILVGFVGILVILQPGLRVFSPLALIPICSALMFALYSLLTRYAARQDSAATSFFWTGVMGAIGMTFYGMFFWEPMIGVDWVWMALLCVLGASGHYLLIRAYEMTEASTIQPFAFLQLAFGSLIGIYVFDETLYFTTALGAAIVLCAGIYTFWREANSR